MKFYWVSTIAFFSFLSSLSFAANLIEPYELAVGAESIVRQVVTKKLLSKADSDFNANLLGALEGSGDSHVRSTLTSFVCERTLGIDDCQISIVIEDQLDSGNEGSSFDLHTRIFQGEVISATIEGFIG